MKQPHVKVAVRRCVSRWAATNAKQTDKLSSLKTVTAATRRTLAREIKKHSDLKACAPLIRDADIDGSLRVTELGDIVWHDNQVCLGGLP